MAVKKEGQSRKRRAVQKEFQTRQKGNPARMAVDSERQSKKDFSQEKRSINTEKQS